MNLTALSLYHGRDASRPVPTNAERIAAFRAIVPPPLVNQVFRFTIKRAKARREA